MKTQNLAPPLVAALAFIVLVTLIATCGSSIPVRAHWPDCETGDGNIFNATLVIAFDQAPTSRLGIGSQIGAFDELGDCVGFATYAGRDSFFIPMWKDDPLTPDKDGFVEGTPFELRYFGESVLYPAMTGEAVAHEDSVYVVSGLAFDEVDTSGLEAQIAALTAELSAARASVSTYGARLDSIAVIAGR